MKKLLLFLALAAAGLQGWAEDLYIVGNATALNDYAWKDDRAPYKLDETGSGTNVYKWTGFLKDGGFKICTGLETWDAYHPKSENQTDNREISEVAQEITTDGTNDRQWIVVNPGIFEVTVDLSQSTKTVVFTPQWTDISTADELIAFASDVVNTASESNYNGARWARLTADIDMNGKSFTGIGCDDKWRRYHGTFDGQGHKISNLNMTSDYCGFITVAGGGCTVKNLLIDNTCSFNGSGRIAALISCCNYTDFGVPVTILNCGNEANVTGTGNDCGGLLGANYGNGCIVTIKNSFNAGNISSTGVGSAPIAGWLGDNMRIENTYNIGSISNDHSNGSFARWATGSLENCFTTTDWGTCDGLTLSYEMAKVYSGELCYNLGAAFTQDLSQTEGHPTFGSKTVGRGQWLSDDYLYYNIDGSGNITITQLNLNESNTKYDVPANVTAKNVTMTRTLKAGVWNTFCSPVALAKSKFSEVKELTGATQNGDNYTMTFSDIEGDNLVAGKPYMVQVSSDLTTPLTATDVAVATSPSSDTFNGLTFNGIFASGSAPNSSFIISNNVFYNVDSDVTLGAFRGYITVGGASVKAVNFEFEDDATGINSPLLTSPEEEGQIYNLAGQRIQKMQKGINIVNGKKVLF